MNINGQIKLTISVMSYLKYRLIRFGSILLSHMNINRIKYFQSQYISEIHHMARIIKSTTE